MCKAPFSLIAVSWAVQKCYSTPVFNHVWFCHDQKQDALVVCESGSEMGTEQYSEHTRKHWKEKWTFKNNETLWLQSEQTRILLIAWTYEMKSYLNLALIKLCHQLSVNKLYIIKIIFAWFSLTIVIIHNLGRSLHLVKISVLCTFTSTTYSIMFWCEFFEVLQSAPTVFHINICLLVKGSTTLQNSHIFCGFGGTSLITRVIFCQCTIGLRKLLLSFIDILGREGLMKRWCWVAIWEMKIQYFKY